MESEAMTFEVPSRYLSAFIKMADAWGASGAAAVFVPSISPSGFYLALRATPSYALLLW